MDGSIIDAVSWAAYVALHLAQYPLTELIDGESGSAEDFELSSDVSCAKKLPLSENGIPIFNTVAKVCAYDFTIINDSDSDLLIFGDYFLVDWILISCRLFYRRASGC